MSFHMKMASPEDFSTLVKKGKNIENGLLKKGSIKHYNSSSSHNESNNNGKPKFWSKNKGVTHDGVTDVKNLQGGNNNHYRDRNNNNSNHDNQGNQQSCNQTQFFPRNNYNRDYDWNRKFPNFREPLEAIFQNLVDHNLMVFPNTHPFDENQPKAKWYRENEYCKYHRIKGHDTNKCIKLKVFIQNLVDDGEIEVEGGTTS